MANYWTILGLPSPPSDMKTVKKAYARKLKVTRPDDDPAGFMALREAYEIAQNEVRYAQANMGETISVAPATIQVTPVTYPDNIEGDKTVSENTSRAHFSDDTPPEISPSPEPEPQYPFFYHEIQSVLHDAQQRNDKNAWASLIASAQDSSIDEYIEFDATLRGSLLSEFGYYNGEADKFNRNRKPPFITSFAATYLFKEMDWHKFEERDYYIQQELDWLRQDMDVMNINRTPRSSGSYKTQKIDESDDTSPSMWLIIFGIIAGIQLLRLILNTIGGGGY